MWVPLWQLMVKRATLTEEPSAMRQVGWCWKGQSPGQTQRPGAMAWVMSWIFMLGDRGRVPAPRGLGRAKLACAHTCSSDQPIDLGDDGVALGLGVVEVGRDADAGPGAVVDQEVALEQAARDPLGAGRVDRHRAAALPGVARGDAGPAPGEDLVEQPAGQ